MVYWLLFFHHENTYLSRVLKNVFRMVKNKDEKVNSNQFFNGRETFAQQNRF